MKKKEIESKWKKPLVVCLVIVMCTMAVPPSMSQSYLRSETPNDVVMDVEFVDVDCAVPDSNPPTIEYDYFYESLAQNIEEIQLGQPTTIHFFQTDLELQLVQSELVPPDGKIYVEEDNGTVEYPMPAVAYTGTVLDEGGEEAALIITDDWISGFAVVGDYVYWNEVVPTDTPLYQPYRSWRVERLREYNESLSDPDEGACEPPSGRSISPGRLINVNRLPSQSVILEREPGPEPMHGWQWERLVGHGDRDFFNLFWWCPWIGINQWFCSFLRILSDLNGVANIYRRDTSVIFTVPAIYVDTTGACGLNSRNALNLLNQFQADMQGRHPNPRYHVAHLLTGKNLNGGTIGIAWRPGHWSLSQQVSEGWWTSYHATAYQRVILESHEIGHNYNAIHGSAERRRHWWPFWPFFHWHYTIMWTPFMGNNMIPDFSNANANRIHANAHTKALAP
ncbi:MAG: hypothetical protein KAR39_12105 [Thermoplasmata archaeon]|nr:hypothetical protein [Thermoplasmata archaeon]